MLSLMRRRPECSHGDDGATQGFEQEIIYNARTLLARAGATANRARRRPGGRGGRAGSVARRPRAGTAAPERENTMKSDEQSRGQAKGFFHRQRGVLSGDVLCAKLRSEIVEIQHELARRLALDIFSIFLHQLAGRVRPVELVRPVQLITLAAPAGRRVNYQAATRRIHGPAGRTAARRVERRPVDGARTPRRVHGRRFPPVEEPRQ